MGYTATDAGMIMAPVGLLALVLTLVLITIALAALLAGIIVPLILAFLPLGTFAALALVSNTAMIYAPLALAKLHDASGLGLAHEFIRSSDPMLKNQAADTIAAAGDEKSVALLEELIAAEPDQNNRNMLDYAKQRLSARLKNLQKK